MSFPQQPKIKNVQFIEIHEVPVGQIFRFEEKYYERISSDVAQESEHNEGYDMASPGGFLYLDLENFLKLCAVRSDLIINEREYE